MLDTTGVALLAVIGTLVGTLGSQYIAAKAALNNKKLEILYVRKVDCYKSVLEKAGDYGADPKNRLY
ncbi:MAG TPA: hypothetical protein VJS43_17165 [Candidatus Acidoferrales bacterium]|nr:hypothetical protein [Candidatus Acidoferrales bacterium]